MTPLQCHPKFSYIFIKCLVIISISISRDYENTHFRGEVILIIRNQPILPALSSVSLCWEPPTPAKPTDLLSPTYFLNFPNLKNLEFEENLANLTLKTEALSTASLIIRSGL